MAADSKDGQNKLSKNIKEQNLKFSVEFHDGDEKEYEEDFDEDLNDTNDVTVSDPAEMENNLAEPQTADREVNGTAGDKSKAQPRSPERPAGNSSPQRVVTTQRKTDTAVNNPAMSKTQRGAADRNGQQNGDTNNRNGRTRERLERKRKWNTKPEEKPGADKKDESVKLPPIQSRYSPSQPPTSNASKYRFDLFLNILGWRCVHALINPQLIQTGSHVKRRFFNAQFIYLVFVLVHVFQIFAPPPHPVQLCAIGTQFVLYVSSDSTRSMERKSTCSKGRTQTHLHFMPFTGSATFSVHKVVAESVLYLVKCLFL